jgi:hypothetical protein
MAQSARRYNRGLVKTLLCVSARVLFAWLLLAAALGKGLPVVAQDAAESLPPAPVTLEDYVAALRAAQDALDDATDPAALSTARATLAEVEQVALPNGTVVTLTPLLGERDEELAPDAAAARVETVLAQLAAAEGDDTAARLATLAAVLAGPAFAQGESPWTAFLRWLAEWLDRLLPDPSPVSGSSPAAEGAGDIAAWIFGGGAIVAIVLLLAYWLRGLIGSFVASAETSSAEEPAGDLPQTPAEARQRAAGSANAGDYRSAVRNLYLAALLTLEQHGLVPADRSLTNREVLARVGSDQPLAAHLQPVVETFDDVWYGVHEPDAGVYRAYTRAIDDLATLAETGAKPLAETLPEPRAVGSGRGDDQEHRP